MAAERTHRAGGGDAGTDKGDDAPRVFREAVAALGAALLRPEVALAPLPSPRRLAPFAHALEATVHDGEEELADGRFVLLHDPQGQEPWQSTFRVVTLGRTTLEPELANDPLLPEVTWSWLTGALEAHGVAHSRPSGTVTRSGSHYFGGLAERQPESELEIRASWTPFAAERADEEAPDSAGHLAAWCDLLCQCAGLPPEQQSGGGAVVPLPQRRGPQPR
ncbi:MAG TPA: DUF3000 domain-containing protein [Streptomyces sp.]|jgi:hypothetical protein|nr:DUF3000 domain-containing protein [Streptomyces sp.]